MIPSWGYPPQKRPDPGRYEPLRAQACLPGGRLRPFGRAQRENLNGKNAMRRTQASGSMLRNSPKALTRALRLAVIGLGIGLVITAGAARAQDDDEDDKTFEEKIIEGIMAGIGGTNMDNRGIEYRERSPLVVPPKLDLPPPDAGAAAVNVPNWPKDPDVAARKAASKKSKPNALEEARALSPAELATKRPKSNANSDTTRPGDPEKNIVLSPKQLGYEGGLFKNLFGGPSSDKAPFTGEPTRESLTQPPSGYQTPSPNYAYGTGPKEVMKNSSDVNPMTGKY